MGQADELPHEEWMKRYEEQNNRLRAQITAIVTGPKARLRRFRRLEYVCRRCGETILSVLNTSPCRVMCFRREKEEEVPGLHDAPVTRPTTVAEGMAEIARSREGHPHRRAIRVGDQSPFVGIPDDFEELWPADGEFVFGRDESWHCLCACAQWNLSSHQIAEDLRSAKRKRSFSPE